MPRFAFNHVVNSYRQFGLSIVKKVRVIGLLISVSMTIHYGQITVNYFTGKYDTFLS